MLIKHVAVVGAGLAGLTTAAELAKTGIAVTVIEARRRVGGRVWTVTDPLTGGAHGELGGEFIDGDHRRLHALAARLGLPLVRILRRGFTQRYRGDSGEYEVSRTRAWDELRDALAPLVRDYQRARGAPDADRVRELSTFSVREWLRRQESPPRVHGIADALRGFFLADPEDLSALPLAAELAQGGSPAQTPIYRIAGGNRRLLEGLAAIPARFLLGHRLNAIAHAADRVILRVTDDRGAQQELQVDAAVLSIPATTLREVAITPALPEAQWRAIRRLRYGCATKAIIQTDRDIFDGRPARAFATDTHAGAFWDASEGQDPDGGLPILSVLAGGSASDALARRLQHGADALLSDLCWLGPRASRVHATASVSWSWESDAFAGGGYAYLDPGFDPGWLPLLRQRAGRLFFAGEHTSEDYQGYMEGAVESGERAAGEIRNG